MALLNFLFAKKHGGAIVFRVEDTDEERSKKEYEDDIIESFTWLGLSWDEFYRQSERTKVYQEAIKDLIDADKAYVSEEESKKNPGEKVHVVRLRNPGTRVTFVDIIRGEISFDTAELGDLRSRGVSRRRFTIFLSSWMTKLWGLRTSSVAKTTSPIHRGKFLFKRPSAILDLSMHTIHYIWLWTGPNFRSVKAMLPFATTGKKGIFLGPCEITLLT